MVRRVRESLGAVGFIGIVGAFSHMGCGGQTGSEDDTTPQTDAQSTSDAASGDASTDGMPGTPDATRDVATMQEASEVDVAPKDDAGADAGRDASPPIADGAITADAHDASSDAPVPDDAVAIEDAAEAAAAGCTPGVPCVNDDDGTQGVCTQRGGTCRACTNDASGDGTCAAAYGSSYVCTNGACVRGECSTSYDCAVDDASAGELCKAGRCVPCASDFSCMDDGYYSEHISGPDTFGGAAMCNTSVGQCVPATCNVADVSCAAAPNTNGNPSDVCCGSFDGNSCVSGNCCQDADCPARDTCNNGVCVADGCANPTFGTVYVDPVNGVDDAMTTGGPRCAFRSLTRAIAWFLAANMTEGTMTIVNDQSAPTLGTASGETFPITLPPGFWINVSNDTPGTHVPIVDVPSGQTGIVAPDSDVQISSLTLDGQGVASTGIAIYAGSDDQGASSLDHVTITGMVDAGMVIGPAAGQTISPSQTNLGPGVVITQTGTSNKPATGLIVSGQAYASISGGSDVDHTSFDGNSEYGVLVIDQAGLSIQGTSVDPSNPLAADVDTNNNGVAGLRIAQNASLANVNGSNVNGLQSLGNPDGIQVTAGSYLVLRSSYLGGNTHAGVFVETVGAAIDDLSTIDLGGRLSGFGLNVLVAAGANNPATGLCLEVGSSVRTLVAAGNLFGNLDCSGAGGTIVRSATCDPNVDLGGIPSTDLATVDVSNCQ